MIPKKIEEKINKILLIDNCKILEKKQLLEKLNQKYKYWIDFRPNSAMAGWYKQKNIALTKELINILEKEKTKKLIFEIEKIEIEKNETKLNTHFQEDVLKKEKINKKKQSKIINSLIEKKWSFVFSKSNKRKNFYYLKGSRSWRFEEVNNEKNLIWNFIAQKLIKYKVYNKIRNEASFVGYHHFKHDYVFLDGGLIFRKSAYLGPKGIWIVGTESTSFICYILQLKQPRIEKNYSFSELEKKLIKINEQKDFLNNSLNSLKNIF